MAKAPLLEPVLDINEFLAQLVEVPVFGGIGIDLGPSLLHGRIPLIGYGGIAPGDGWINGEATARQKADRFVIEAWPMKGRFEPGKYLGIMPVGLNHLGVAVTKGEFDQPIAVALKAGALPEGGAEFGIISRCERGQHIPGLDDLRLNARDAGEHLEGRLQIIGGNAGHGRGDLVVHQLHPEFGGLVHDNEQQFIMAARQWFLGIKDAVELQIIRIAHGFREIGVDPGLDATGEGFIAHVSLPVGGRYCQIEVPVWTLPPWPASTGGLRGKRRQRKAFPEEMTMEKPPLQESAEIAIDRAGHELRRGRMVRILGQGDGGATAAFVVQAVETLAAPAAGFWRNLPGATLALTAKRAAVLHIGPTGSDTILLPLADLPGLAGCDDGALAGLIFGLANATDDLNQPMRGPFKRLKMPAAELLKSAQAAIQLAKAAALLPAILIAPAPETDLSFSIALATALEARSGSNGLREVAHARLPLAGAENCRIMAFRPNDGGPEHFALIVGAPDVDQPVLVRLHSECFTGDLLGSLKCDCGEQLRGAIAAMHKAGAGIVLYLAQEGRGIGLINKLRAYQLQDQGFDTVDANERLGFESDERVFAPAAAMLAHLGIKTVRLMTNNPEKVTQLAAEGVDVAERVPHAFPANNHNEAYLAVKKRRSGHYL